MVTEMISNVFATHIIKCFSLGWFIWLYCQKKVFGDIIYIGAIVCED